MPFESDEIVLKKYKILDVIKSDLHAADLKITLFMTAYQSKKLLYEAVHKTKCTAKHKCSLEMMQCVPGIPKLLFVLREPKVWLFDQLVFEILYWLMVAKCDPKINTVPSVLHKEILALVRDDAVREKCILPDHIFKINYCSSSENSQNWDLKKSQNTVKYGYQPLQLQDCFATIFCNTQTIPEKKATFISTNLTEALKRTSFNKSWCRSMLGFNVKVIMLVQFIERNLKETKLSCKNIFSDRNFFAGTQVVARSSYLLVYKKKISKQSLRAKYATILLIIALLLGLISFVASRCYNKQCIFTF